MMDVATGPACPRCGCKDTDVLRRPTTESRSWFGAGEARCSHCRLRFHFHATTSPPIESQSPPIESQSLPINGTRPKFRVFLCGECGGKCRVARTRDGIRSYKCADCGRIYKVVGEETVELRD